MKTCSRSRTAPMMAEINITPLVDVLLTVLIIFMVTTPLVTHQWNLPLNGTVDSKASADPVVFGLSIRDTGELVLDGHSSSRASLDEQLRLAIARGTLVQLDVRPEAHSSYDNLANVLAIAQTRGVSNLRVFASTTP